LIKEEKKNTIIHEIFLHEKKLVQRYDTLLNNCSDSFIQQSSDWARVIKNEGPDKPLFLLFEENGKDIAGIPLYLFEEGEGNILTSIPHPGPLGGIFSSDFLSQNKKKIIYKKLINHIDKLAVRYNCILFSTITNPITEDYTQYKEVFTPDFELENFTQIIDLTKPSTRSHGVRNNINKAKNNKLEITYSKDVDTFSKWVKIHNKRHHELGITPLKKELLNKIFKMINKSGNGNFISIYKEDKIIAGGIFINNNFTMDVYMLSFDKQYSKFKPNYILIDEIIKIAEKKKIKYFNWQSSASRNDGVYEFKRQWGSIEKKYYYLTKIYCSPEKIKSIGLINIKAKYPNHFLIPFGFFESEFNQTNYIKGD